MGGNRRAARVEEAGVDWEAEGGEEGSESMGRDDEKVGGEEGDEGQVGARGVVWTGTGVVLNGNGGVLLAGAVECDEGESKSGDEAEDAGTEDAGTEVAAEAIASIAGVRPNCGVQCANVMTAYEVVVCRLMRLRRFAKLGAAWRHWLISVVALLAIGVQEVVAGAHGTTGHFNP